MWRRSLPALIVALTLLGGQAAAQSLRPLARALDQAVGRVLVLDGRGRLVSTGSGYAIGPAGRGVFHFLTNNHVVEDAERILVAWGEDGEVAIFSARVLNTSPSFDMALLELAPEEAGGFTPAFLPLADRSIERGDDVAAMGFPGTSDALVTSLDDPAFVEPTLTTGIISKVFDGSWGGRGLRMKMIQHDAVINSGNSGGPLTDLCGGVLGLNTAVATQGQGTFFASSATAIGSFLDNSDVEYRVATEVCDGRIVVSRSGGLPFRPVMVAAGALIVMGGIALRGPISARAAQALGRGDDGPALLYATIGDRDISLDGKALREGVTIGRAPEAGISVDHAALSRAHARLRLEGRRLTIRDLGSTNGTSVDGRRLDSDTSVQINSSSRIKLGDLALSIQKASGA